MNFSGVASSVAATSLKLQNADRMPNYNCSKLNVAGAVYEVCVDSSCKQGQRIMDLSGK